MTTDEMISQLGSLLGDISTLDAQILTELRLAQTQAERGPLLPWFLLKEAYTLTSAGSGVIEIPDDFLREAEDGGFAVILDGKFENLCKYGLDDLREEYEGEASGRPEYYALLGTEFWVFPLPDAEYRIQMHYYKKDTQLAVGDSGNLWSTYYPDLLIGLAGQNLCLHQRTLDIKPRFDEMVMVARQQLVVDNTAREMQNMEMSFG